MKKALFLLIVLAVPGSSQAPDSARPRCGRPDRPCYFATFEDAAEAARWKGTGGATVDQSTEFPAWCPMKITPVRATPLGGWINTYIRTGKNPSVKAWIRNLAKRS